jgi:hypothetical protein
LSPAVDVLFAEGARPKRDAPRKAVVEAIMMTFSAEPKKPARTATGPARRAAGREDWEVSARGGFEGKRE